MLNTQCLCVADELAGKKTSLAEERGLVRSQDTNKRKVGILEEGAGYSGALQGC